MDRDQKLSVIASLREQGFTGDELKRRAGVAIGARPGPATVTAANDPDNANSDEPLPEVSEVSVDDIQRNPKIKIPKGAVLTLGPRTKQAPAAPVEKHPIAEAVDAEEETRPFSNNTGPDLAGQLRGEAAAVAPTSFGRVAGTALTDLVDTASFGLFRRARDAIGSKVAPESTAALQAEEAKAHAENPTLTTTAKGLGYVTPVGLPGMLGRAGMAGAERVGAKLAETGAGRFAAANPVIGTATKGAAIGAPVAGATALGEDVTAGVPISEALPRAGEAAKAGAGFGAILGAGAGVAKGAKGRVVERIKADTTAGEGGVAKKATREKVSERAGEDNALLESTLAEDPKLAAELHGNAKRKPGIARDALDAKVESLHDEAQPFYKAINDRKPPAPAAHQPNESAIPSRIDPETGQTVAIPGQTVADRAYKKAIEDAAKLEAKAVEKEARAASLPAAARGKQDAAAASARRIADVAKAEAEQMKPPPQAQPAAPAATEAAPVAAPRPAGPVGGIEVGAAMDRLGAESSRLRKSGDLAAADALDKITGYLNRPENFGANPIQKAEAIRKIATSAGNAAFDAPAANTAASQARVTASRALWREMSTAIEDAALEANVAGAGLDIDRLRKINRQMSLLIPMRDAVGQRAIAAEIKPQASTIRKVLTAPFHPIRTAQAGAEKVADAAESAVRGVDFKLSRLPTDLKVGQPAGAVQRSVSAVTPQNVAQIVQFARGGATRDEIDAKAKELGMPPEVAANIAYKYGKPTPSVQP